MQSLDPSSQVNRPRRMLRNYMLQPLLQVRLGLYSILLGIFFSLAFVCITYSFLHDFVTSVILLTDSESEVQGLFLAQIAIMRWWVGGVIALFLFLNIFISIVYTHRLVGPSVAFGHQIKRLLAGDYSGTVTLRKGDAFGELAHLLNQLTEKLAGKEQSPPKGTKDAT